MYQILVLCLCLATGFTKATLFDPIKNITEYGSLECFIDTGLIVVNYRVYNVYLNGSYNLRYYPVTNHPDYIDIALNMDLQQHYISHFNRGALYKLELTVFNGSEHHAISAVELLAETLHQNITSDHTVIWSWPRISLFTFSKLWFTMEIPWWITKEYSLPSSVNSFTPRYIPACSEYILTLYGQLGPHRIIVGNTSLTFEHWNRTCYNPEPITVSTQLYRSHVDIMWTSTPTEHLLQYLLTIQSGELKFHHEVDAYDNHYIAELNGITSGLVSLLGRFDYGYRLLGQKLF